MNLPGQATIFAFATPPARSAIALLRVSGSQTRAILEKLCGLTEAQPRRAYLKSIHAPSDGTQIDSGLVTFFNAPASYTGEDMAEFGLHGAPSILRLVQSELALLHGVRPAEPGEFSRRAFLNRKLDLTEVEGIADLIDSDTELQRRQALRIAQGGLSKKLRAWRDLALHISAMIETQLDFSDEGDVSALAVAPIQAEMRNLADQLSLESGQFARTSRIRNGLTVVIAGPVNAGKSTLFNAIALRDVALVSPYPGTTRDVLRVDLDIGGLPITLIDTAGQRAADDPVEQMGIIRAREAVESADLILWVNALDAQEPFDGDTSRAILVWNKGHDASLSPWVCVDAQSGAGVDLLLTQIAARLGDLSGDSGGLLIRERHVSAVRCAQQALLSAIERLQLDQLELAAEEMREVQAQFALIGGGFEHEQILDEIFSRFCIGK
jgi:tRNA modification GTPase